MGCHCFRDKKLLSSASLQLSSASEPSEIPRLAITPPKDPPKSTSAVHLRSASSELPKLERQENLFRTAERKQTVCDWGNKKGNEGLLDLMEVGLKTVREASGKLACYYRVEAGSARLLKAEQRETKKRCCIQICSLDTEQQSWKRQRAEAMRTLDHPNILRVLDILQAPNRLYVVCEDANGGTAESQLEGRELGEECATVIMRQVFAALSHCHSRSLVCGSLSLKRILFAAPPGENCMWVKLLVSLECEDAKSQFIAPEVRKKQFYGPANDLYSCGMILSYLLTGDLGSKPKTVSSMELSTSSRNLPKLSKEAKALLDSLLASDYSRRPTVEECLRHPWLAVAQSKPTFDLCTRTALRNLAAIRPTSSLKKAFFSLMLNLVLTSDDLRTAEEAFTKLDTDLDGEVSEADLQGSIFRLFPGKQAQTVFTAITSIAVFSIERKMAYSEFLLWASMPALLSLPNLKKAFQLLSQSGEKQVRGKHLRELLSLNAEKCLDLGAWRLLIESISGDDKDAFNFKQFCLFMQKV